VSQAHLLSVEEHLEDPRTLQNFSNRRFEKIVEEHGSVHGRMSAG